MKTKHKSWRTTLILGTAIIVFAGLAAYAVAVKLGPNFAPQALALDFTGKKHPTYAGATPTTYTGNLGGIIGANAKCAAAFSGSHMCSMREILASGATTLQPSGAFGWVNCDLYHFGSGSPAYTTCDTMTGPNWLGSGVTTDLTCNQWQNNSNTMDGTGVFSSTAATQLLACNTTLAIECCSH